MLDANQNQNLSEISSRMSVDGNSTGVVWVNSTLQRATVPIVTHTGSMRVQSGPIPNAFC